MKQVEIRPIFGKGKWPQVVSQLGWEKANPIPKSISPPSEAFPKISSVRMLSSVWSNRDE